MDVNKGHVWKKTRDGQRDDFTARHNDDFTVCGPICTQCGYTYDITRQQQPDAWCVYSDTPVERAPAPVRPRSPISAELSLAGLVILLMVAAGGVAWWVVPVGVLLLFAIWAIWRAGK